MQVKKTSGRSKKLSRRRKIYRKLLGSWNFGAGAATGPGASTGGAQGLLLTLTKN